VLFKILRIATSIRAAGESALVGNECEEEIECEFSGLKVFEPLFGSQSMVEPCEGSWNLSNDIRDNGHEWFFNGTGTTCRCRKRATTAGTATCTGNPCTASTLDCSQLTPIEKAEVDKGIAEHGLNVIQRYMAYGNLNRNDADRILRYLTYFVIQGANVNAKGTAGGLGGSGFTALHAATTLGRVEIARFLVSHGADINALWSTDGAELTPLDWGTLHLTRTDAIRIEENRRRGIGEVVAYLKSIGAKTGGGGTPSFMPVPLNPR